MVNTNIHKFSQKELADIYEKIILLYEQTNGLQGRKLSVRAKPYRKLIKILELQVQRFKKQEDLQKAILPDDDFGQNLIWFYDKQNNSLKSIYYHLRNSAAHADIRRVKSNQLWYLIEHRYQHKLNFVCYMKKTDFWKFVDNAKNNN